MIVVVTIGCPAGLRGDITRWLNEISAGVYVGNVSARVRERLWKRLCEYAGKGQVLMILPSKNEQGYEVRGHNYGWASRDFDGLTFMQRTADDDPETFARERRPWPRARRYRSGSRG